jgi:hypothetical protein
MKLASALDWIAWAGLMLPLAVLAWSAVQFVNARKYERKHENYLKYFAIVKRLGEREKHGFETGAMLFELKNFEDQAEYTDRMLKHFRVEGPDEAFLSNEIRLTLEYLEKNKR